MTGSDLFLFFFFVNQHFTFCSLTIISFLVSGILLDQQDVVLQATVNVNVFFIVACSYSENTYNAKPQFYSLYYINNVMKYFSTTEFVDMI